MMPLAPLIAILALADAPRCSGTVVLRVPLAATQHRYTTKVEGYTVAVAKDAPAWVVEVFAASDRPMRDNLLAPQRNWHGAFPFQVQPGSEALFGGTREIMVRGGQAHACIRLVAPQAVEERFVSGMLEVIWDTSSQDTGARRTTTR